MPIDYKKYPKDWMSQIRPDILARANNCCEMCGVPNYAVGHWEKKEFKPMCGTRYMDEAGQGKLPYSEGRKIAEHHNSFGADCTGYNVIVIVLTIAHLDHNVSNNDYKNLKAMCQRCHNQYDAQHRKMSRNDYVVLAKQNYAAKDGTIKRGIEVNGIFYAPKYDMLL